MAPRNTKQPQKQKKQTIEYEIKIFKVDFNFKLLGNNKAQNNK